MQRKRHPTGPTGKEWAILAPLPPAVQRSARPYARWRTGPPGRPALHLPTRSPREYPPAVVAYPLDGEREAARMIADEEPVALPMVDDEGKMLGIVTVDDAVDVMLPTAWKIRIPQPFRERDALATAV